jgi:hypothetical protein
MTYLQCGRISVAQHVSTPLGLSSGPNFMLCTVFMTNMDLSCEVIFDSDIALLQDLQSES